MSVVPKVFFNGFTGRGNACKLEGAKSLRAEAPRKVRGRPGGSLAASAFGKCSPKLRIGLVGARATDTEQSAPRCPFPPGWPQFGPRKPQQGQSRKMAPRWPKRRAPRWPQVLKTQAAEAPRKLRGRPSGSLRSFPILGKGFIEQQSYIYNYPARAVSCALIVKEGTPEARAA